VSQGLPQWLAPAVEKARFDNQTLRDNGATGIATGRDQLLNEILDAFALYCAAEVEVSEAAALLGCAEETIRRRVRNGKITANRTKPRGKIRIPVSDLAAVAPLKGGAYNPAADARNIAPLRRGL